MAAVAIAACLTASVAEAAPVPTQRQSWYYEIGGAEPISAPANPNASSITLGAGAALNLGYSCGRFDITASVSNMFGDITNSLQNTLMNTARGAIAALPLYIMQRAAPGLYELFQSYAVDFKRTFDLAQKSCEDFERDILAGKDPYAGWLALAKGESWKAEMAAGNDAVAAKENVENQGGDSGLTWLGGARAAGAGQSPIQPVRDSVEAGWNMELDRAPTDNTGYVPPPVDPPRLVELFPTRQDAGNFAVRVLGDQVIRTCDGCTREAIGGHGLLPEYNRERADVATTLSTLVGGTAVPTSTELEAITAPGVGIGANIIQTLRRLPPDEQSIMAGRLASEIALARTVERMLTIRRLALTARREPNVQGNQEAQEAIAQAVGEIEQEVEYALYEGRVRKEISSNTAAMLIARDNQLRGEGARTPRGSRAERVHMDEGGRFQ
ncbi:MAG: integrating conjugative element protein [Candidatus Sedimenticola endophacoides]